MTPTEFRINLRLILKQYDSQKQAAERWGVSEAYLSDVIRGRREPGELILNALHYKRVVSYEPDADS